MNSIDSKLKNLLISLSLLLAVCNSLFGQEPDWTTACDLDWTRYGEAITSGDFNGDGFDDIVVGDGIYNWTGRVFIYFGSSTGPSVIPNQTIDGNSGGYSFSIDGEGDLNGDGYNDLIVGDPWNTLVGKVFIYLGSPTGLSSIPDYVLAPVGLAPEDFGRSVTTADVNGDGYSDVIASIAQIDQVYTGAYVYFGSPDVLSVDSPDVFVETPQPAHNWGNAGIGDVNDDGFDDFCMIVGGTHCYMFYGANNLTTYWTSTFGINLFSTISYCDGAGDVNSDGYDDLLVKAYDSTHLYFGTQNGLNQNSEWKIATSNCLDIQSVSSAGDYNNDGYDDIAVSNCDMVKMFFGSPTGPKPDALQFRRAVLSLSSGDVNGDGISDLLSTEYHFAYAYYGHDGSCEIQGPSLIFTTGTPAIFWSQRSQSGYFELTNYGMTNASILENVFEGDTIAVAAGEYAGYFDLHYRNDTVILCSKRVYVEEALPVELNSFNSDNRGRNVYLTWSTSSELNNSGFEIQRAVQSDKLKVESELWSKIGFVNGSGTTNEVREYSFTDRNLETGKYKFRLKQIDFNGNFEYFELAEAVSIGIPDKYDLSQNYPNPFNPLTTINYDLPSDGIVTLIVYDILGRELKTLVNEMKTAGYHKIQFNAADLASGAYFYRMTAGEFVAVKKFVVLK